MLPLSVGANLSFASLDRLSKGGIVDRGAEATAIEAMVRLLAIKTASVDTPVGSLSGGNQQKVVIAKWLMRGPRIILLNDPTRGIDVGTKQEIYRLLRRLADEGAAILLYSTDYAELIGCCDRVLVVYDGTIRRELAGDDITEHALISSALAMEAPSAVAAPTGEAGGRPATTPLSDWRYRFRDNASALSAALVFVVIFGLYIREPSGRFQRQRGADGRQQGRAAGPRGGRPDVRGPDGRDRPVGRGRLHPGRLPGLGHRPGLADRPWRSGSPAFC